MKRDISKTLAAYKKLGNNGRDFYLSDYYSLMNDADGKTLFNIIDTALRYGYVVGYRSAKRRTRKAKTSVSKKEQND